MPYGPASTTVAFSPSAGVLPTSPAILSHADTGAGKMTVTVSVPVVSPPVKEITLFYSLLGLASYDTDRLFQLVTSDGNAYKMARVAVTGAPVSVDIPVEALAPGQTYNWRAAASNG